MAYQRALNEKVAQLSVPPETCPGKPLESHHQRRAQEKEMKEYMAALDAMSAHHCDNAFFDIKFGHNPIGITLATPSDMMHLGAPEMSWVSQPANQPSMLLLTFILNIPSTHCITQINNRGSQLKI
jgi:hypothetical protein